MSAAQDRHIDMLQQRLESHRDRAIRYRRLAEAEDEAAADVEHQLRERGVDP